VVDCEDTYRTKEQWVKFLPNVTKIKDPNEKEKEEVKALDPDMEPKLQVAWRYNNLLSQEQNAGEISSTPNQAFGKGL